MATTVLGLKTFTASDPVDYNEINDNYNKIDSGVKTALQGRAAHNWLHNSDFRIAQAGYGGMHETQKYACDRWYDTYGYGSFSFDESQGLTITYGTNHAYLVQKIDGASLLHGKSVTLAMQLSDGTVYVKSGVFNSSGASFQIVVDNGKTFTLYYDRAEFVVNSGSVTIKWAALYEGSYTASTLPAYQPKGYAAELAECHRYYQTIPALTHIPGVTNTSVSFGAKYKIPTMRIAPTVSIASGQEVSIYTGEYSTSTTNYTMQYASNPNQITLNITLSAGSFVAYKPGMLTFPVDIALSADL